MSMAVELDLDGSVWQVMLAALATEMAGVKLSVGDCAQLAQHSGHTIHPGGLPRSRSPEL